MRKKLSVKAVVLALIFAMVMPMGAFATVEELTADCTQPGKSLAGIYPAYDDIEFQYSKTEEATHEVTFETGMAAADLEKAVADGTIGFSLDRDEERGYLDPELYPFQTTIGDITGYTDYDSYLEQDIQVIQPKEFKVDGSKLTVTFQTYGTEFYYSGDPEAKANGVGKIYSIDHTNGGKWLDNCGYYDFNAVIGDKVVGSVHAKVVPYDSYRTAYELYDDIESYRAYEGDRYVEVGSMGQTSIDGYDLPYVIVAANQEDVEAWKAYTDLAESNPTQVLADIEAGKYDDLAVPVYISNCHTNENPAVNGPMNFMEILMNEDTISLKTLEAYTEAGKAQLEYEKAEVFGTSISELYAPFCTELGRLRGENGDISDRSAGYGYSNVVDFEKYYEMGKDEFKVDELLDDVFFISVPTMNMEGYMQSTRATGVGFDPNRDYANQTMYEDRNAMAFMSDWNPMAYAELHGRVEGYSVEPCGAPHNPNIEYDLIVEQFFEMGEAVGKAMVANNEKFNSYELCGRDYIEIDENSLNENNKVQWGQPWDDLSTNFGSQFPVFYGTAGITWEQPAYSDITAEQSIPAGLFGLGRYIQEHKVELLTSQAKLFERGVTNYNSNEDVAMYYVDQYDRPYAQADLMRTVNDGEGENGNFYPECFIIPLDKDNQKNIQDAAEAVVWIVRNGMEYKIADAAFTYDGVEYPEGTVIASMYQAKRSLLHANLGPGSYVTVWKGLYSEAYCDFSNSRGFDMITVTEPAAYKAIDEVCVPGLDYADTLAAFAGFGAQFSGVEGADVIISNASEDSAVAVNRLLKAGKTVAMITAGEYMGDFICSYEDYLTIADDCIVAAEGVYGADIEAAVIAYSPVVYINGGYGDEYYTGGNIELPGGNSYCFDEYALKHMEFDITGKATKADAVVGNGFGSANPNDAVAKQAVLEGTPYMVWGSGAGLSGILDGVQKGSMSNGTDMLAIVGYPEVTLINANYEADGDYVNYQYGTDYFAAMPEGAVPLVQNVGETPISGCVGIFDEAGAADFEVYNNAVVAFEYQEDGMDIVAFANSLVHKGHPQDEFKFIANFLFSRALADEAYVGVEEPVDTPDEPVVDPDEPTVEPDEPTDEPADEPADKPADEDADAEGADTGDNANILAWLALAVVAGAGTVVYKRKRQ